MKPSLWRCPICHAALQLQERSFTCSNHHRFDQAKEGYVNLLRVNRKHSADPGDNKAMLESRRHFLQQGFYAPLAQALGDAIRQHFSADTANLTLLDAGCGEGYYLSQLAVQLGGGAYWGTDISRAAMRLAAKAYPNMQFAVASSFELPLADEAVDAVVRVFAPASAAEITRVLKTGGVYLWAYPGELHLFELRQRIYDEPKPHTVETLPPLVGMTEGVPLRVQYRITLPDAESIAALLAMTPYYWSASADKQAQCQTLQTLDLTVDFVISQWQKSA